MRCKRCGNEIHHVPEHLRDLAEWLCSECSNTAPRRDAVGFSDEPIQKQMSGRRKRKAA